MIICYSGKMRSGKSYVMAKNVYKHFLLKNRVVYSNMAFDYYGDNLHYWSRLEDLYALRNAIIVMDEIHVYLNSRSWKNAPLEFLRQLSQSGKKGVHIVATVQNVGRIDTVFRELIDYFYWVERYPYSSNPYHDPKKPILFRVNQHDSMMAVRGDLSKPARSRFVLFSKKWANRYDTSQEVKEGKIPIFQKFDCQIKL
jgi:hypothetical protein